MSIAINPKNKMKKNCNATFRIITLPHCCSFLIAIMQFTNSFLFIITAYFYIMGHRRCLVRFFPFLFGGLQLWHLLLCSYYSSPTSSSAATKVCICLCDSYRSDVPHNINGWYCIPPCPVFSGKLADGKIMG